MKEKISHVQKAILSYIMKLSVLWVVYSPVVLGILSVMMGFYGILIVIFLFFPISWILADPTILLTSDIHGSWINSYLGINIDYNSLIMIEIVIFSIGGVLLISAFIQLTTSLTKTKSLCQKGIYQYIRHPQNLGIIIMVFPLALYVPGLDDAGIRFADLISWIQFTLVVVLYSEWEEGKLKRTFPTEFPIYKKNTGFMFPKLITWEKPHIWTELNDSIKKYGLIILVYILSVLIIYLFYCQVPTIQWM
jgi:protein-S-isoprenylcysteine O-methyltransferase Ste14